jgi:hypothetical protein
MGFMTNTKKSSVIEDAQLAWDEGAVFFAAELNHPTMLVGNNSGLGEWSGELSGVAAVGWKLHQWTVSTARNGNLVGFPVFTR